MSITEKLEKLSPGMADIRNALKNKEVTMPTTAKVRDVPDYIRKLEKKGPVFLCSGQNFNNVIYPLRSYITAIIFTTTDPPTSGTTDLSDGKKGNIWGWRNGSTYYISGKQREVYIKDAYMMFQNMTNLVSIDFGAVNTTQNTTMKNMFYGCTKLTTLTNFSKLSTKSVTTMNSLFYNCSALSSVNLTGFNTSLVTDMHYMFYGCSGLSSINTSNISTTSVTDMSGMFRGCTKLASLPLNSSGWNTSKVKDMSYMFYGCTALTGVTMSSLSTVSVTNMSYMFYNCNKITELLTTYWDTSNVTDMSYMFYGCTSLKTLTTTQFKTQNVTNMKYMFYNCSAITSLNLSTWNTTKVTNMEAMFIACSSCTSFNLSSFNTSKVTTFYYMFSGCSAVRTLNLMSFTVNSIASNGVNGMFASCSSLTTINANDWTNYSNVVNSTGTFTGCTSILKGGISWTSGKTSGAYCKCNGGYFMNNTLIRDTTLCKGSTFNTKLNSIVGNANKLIFTYSSPPSNVSTVDVSEAGNNSAVMYLSGSTIYVSAFGGTIYANSDCSWMFEKITSLSTIEFTNFNTSKLENMLAMFNRCTGLVTLNLNFDTSKVTYMSSLFYECNNLKNLTLNFNNTSSLISMSQMFVGCTSLSSVNLSKFNINNIHENGAMFMFMQSNVQTIYANNWTSNSNITNDEKVFMGAYWLKGAISFESTKTSGIYANYTTGYFTRP